MSDPVLERLAADMAAEALRCGANEADDEAGLRPKAIETLLVANGVDARYLAKILSHSTDHQFTPDFVRGVVYGRRTRNAAEGTKRLIALRVIAATLGYLAGFTYKEIWGHDDPTRGGK